MRNVYAAHLIVQGIESIPPGTTLQTMASPGSLTVLLSVQRRTYRLTSAGDVSAILMQAGREDGDTVTVINIGTHTLTFDIVGNSLVSGGAAVAVTAGAKRIMTWSAADGLWYP